MWITPISSGSKGNAYIVSDGQTSLLLDCGVPIEQIQKAFNYKVSYLAGCLVTHCHKDHCKAAKDVLSKGIDLYTSEGTIGAMGLISHRLRPVKSLANINIGTFTVTPFDTQHDVPEPLGFFLVSQITGERLLYFTDTYYLKYRFSGITHLMAECNYDLESIRRSIAAGYITESLAKRIIKSHMSLEHLIEMIKANDMKDLKQVYLLHLSDNNSDEKLYKDTIQRITGAEVYVC